MIKILFVCHGNSMSVKDVSVIRLFIVKICMMRRLMLIP